MPIPTRDALARALAAVAFEDRTQEYECGEPGCGAAFEPCGGCVDCATRGVTAAILSDWDRWTDRADRLMCAMSRQEPTPPPSEVEIPALRLPEHITAVYIPSGTRYTPDHDVLVPSGWYVTGDDAQQAYGISIYLGEVLDAAGIDVTEEVAVLVAAVLSSSSARGARLTAPTSAPEES